MCLCVGGCACVCTCACGCTAVSSSDPFSIIPAPAPLAFLSAVLCFSCPFSCEMFRQLVGRAGRYAEVCRAVLYSAQAGALGTLETQLRCAKKGDYASKRDFTYPPNCALAQRVVTRVLQLQAVISEAVCLRPHITGVTGTRCVGSDIACSVCRARACPLCVAVSGTAAFSIRHVAELVIAAIPAMICRGNIELPPGGKRLTALQVAKQVIPRTAGLVAGSATALLGRDDILGVINRLLLCSVLGAYWCDPGSGSLYVGVTRNVQLPAEMGMAYKGIRLRSSRCPLGSHPVCQFAALPGQAGAASSADDSDDTDADLSQLSQASGYGTVHVASALFSRMTITNAFVGAKGTLAAASRSGGSGTKRRRSSSSAASPARAVAAAALPSTPARPAAGTARQLFTAHSPSQGLQLCTCDPDSAAAGHCLSPRCIYAGTF